jgi:hypothetical protein
MSAHAHAGSNVACIETRPAGWGTGFQSLEPRGILPVESSHEIHRLGGSEVATARAGGL